MTVCQGGQAPAVVEDGHELAVVTALPALADPAVVVTVLAQGGLDIVHLVPQAFLGADEVRTLTAQ